MLPVFLPLLSLLSLSRRQHLDRLSHQRRDVRIAEAVPAPDVQEPARQEIVLVDGLVELVVVNPFIIRAAEDDRLRLGRHSVQVKHHPRLLKRRGPLIIGPGKRIPFFVQGRLGALFFEQRVVIRRDDHVAQATDRAEQLPAFSDGRQRTD